jgi:hypothetical protein
MTRFEKHKVLARKNEPRGAAYSTTTVSFIPPCPDPQK